MCAKSSISFSPFYTSHEVIDAATDLRTWTFKKKNSVCRCRYSEVCLNSVVNHTLNVAFPPPVIHHLCEITNPTKSEKRVTHYANAALEILVILIELLH